MRRQTFSKHPGPDARNLLGVVGNARVFLGFLVLFTLSRVYNSLGERRLSKEATNSQQLWPSELGT